MRAFFLVITLVLVFQGNVLAADDSISIPTQAQVEQQGDLSLAVITKLFGNTADFLIGSGNVKVDGEAGFFSGLIVSVLGVLNFAAMIYVSSMIVYMWGVFAVTTAHQGEKLGQGVYNSLWIPIRHGLSFGLIVPVINGLSVMQVGILLCIGIGINFANVVWNFSGAYLVKNINIQAQTNTFVAERENAYKFLPIMFKNAVVQEIILDKMQHDKSEKIWEKEYKAYDPSKNNTPGENNGYDPENRDGLAFQEYPINYDGVPDKNGKLLRVDDYLNGRIIIRTRDLAYVRFNFLQELFDSEARSNPGIIQIRMPKWGYDFIKPTVSEADDSYMLGMGMKGQVFTNQDDALSLRQYYEFKIDKNNEEYQKQRAFSEQKTKRLLALWKSVSEAANVYIHSYASAKGSCAVSPCRYDATVAGEYLGKEMANALNVYSRGVAEDVTEASQSVSKEKDAEKKQAALQRKIESAIDSKDGKSVFGWMSAGLFPFALASVQQSINAAVNTRISGYNGTITDSMLKFQKELKKMLEEDDQKMNANYLAGIEQASSFYDRNIGRSANFSSRFIAKTENTKSYIGLNDLKDNLISAFAQKKDGIHETHAGILGWTLDEIGSQDPILVLCNFGNRLFHAASTLLVGGVFISLVNNMSGLALVLACLGLLLTGGFFAYAVPMIPVIYWLKALISWIFMCVESMVAAPFWVCAHALPEGAGFAGNHARRGYMMLLDIVARPVLLVIGAVFAVILAQLAGVFIYKMFNIMFISIISVESISIFADVIYSILVMSMVYYVFYMVFTKGVNYMPEHVINWCGGQAGGLRDEEDGTANILHAGGATQQLKSMTGKIQPALMPGKR